MSEQDQFSENLDGFEEITADIHTWHEPGERLIGKLTSIEPFQEGSFDTICLKYKLDTPEGRVSTVLGAAADAQIANTVKPGDLVAIVYLGKKDLSDGRKVNRFKVLVKK